MPAESDSLGTILLVEDELSDARLLMRAFTRAGVQNPVKHLMRGDAALAFLQGIDQYADRRQHPLPILIILDLKLPGMSGLELLRWIRLQRPLRRIPVLILTNEKDGKYMEAAYDAGANSYLLKSFDHGEIDRVVNLITEYWLSLNESPLLVKRTGT
jgi:DNA-binding response OmpR family regulator